MLSSLTICNSKAASDVINIGIPFCDLCNDNDDNGNRNNNDAVFLKCVLTV
jgi:hypothetical protein